MEELLVSESEFPNQEESHSYSINIEEISDDEIDRIENYRLREVMKQMKKYSDFKEEIIEEPLPPGTSRKPVHAKIIIEHVKNTHVKSPPPPPPP
jgi:hypothetical protein